MIFCFQNIVLLYIQVRATNYYVPSMHTPHFLDISIQSNFSLLCSISAPAMWYNYLNVQMIKFLFGWFCLTIFTLHVLYTYRHRFQLVKVSLSVEITTPKLVPFFRVSTPSQWAAGGPLKSLRKYTDHPENQNAGGYVYW